MKRLRLPLLVLIIGAIAVILISRTSPSKKIQEEIAESLPKYPNSQEYKSGFDTGFPDGTKHGYAEFKTNDSCIAIDSYYRDNLINKGWKEVPEMPGVTNESSEIFTSSNYVNNPENKLWVYCRIEQSDKNGKQLDTKTKQVSINIY